MKNDEANQKLGFQTLDVYVAARELVAVVGRAKIDDRELRDQATRASKSVLLRLSEGLPHRTQPMRRKYFAEANGSVYEVAAAVDVAGLLGVMRETDVRAATALCIQVTQMLSRMMR
jgi:four helix bundle protein